MSKKNLSDLDRWWLSILAPVQGEREKKTNEALEQSIQTPVLGAPPAQSQKIQNTSLNNRENQNKTGTRHLCYYLGSEYPGIFLTKRELHCVRHYSDGLTIKQAAKQMSICYRSAEYLIVNVRKKLNCSKAKDLLIHGGLMKLIKNKNPRVTRRRQTSLKKVEEVC